MAIVAILKDTGDTEQRENDPAVGLFVGPRARWRGSWDRLWRHVSTFGDDVSVQPTQKYLGLTRGGRMFAIVAATGDRFDIGYNFDQAAVFEGLSAAGSWNNLVTHRASIHTDDSITVDLLRLLHDAYHRAGR
jgi:Domain of unknown function (DUF5655)